jgi:hypothetical protein
VKIERKVAGSSKLPAEKKKRNKPPVKKKWSGRLKRKKYSG